MNYKHLYAFIAISVGCMLASCHSKLDLHDIDTTAEVPVKLALPVGSMSAKVSDFFGTSDEKKFYIDTLGGENILTMKIDVEKSTQTFDGFDFAGKMPDAAFPVNLYDSLKDAKIYNETLHDSVNILQPGNQIVVPAGYTFSDAINVKMTLTLNDVNKPGVNERVDKVKLTNAYFDILVDKSNFDDLSWNWIEEITMDLGDQFAWEGHSNTLTLYKKGETAVADFGQALKIEMDEVTLNLMKDASKTPSDENVINYIQVGVKLKYVVPAGTYSIAENSGINCDFKVKKLVPEVIWGWALSENGASDSREIDIDFNDISFLKNACLPIAEPQIFANIETPVAGNLKVIVNDLYTVDANGNKQYANFNGVRPNVTPYEKIFKEADGCINPQTSSLDAVARVNLKFDHTDSLGHIDSMFLQMPNKLGYKIAVGFDKESCPQVRLTNNLYASIDAEAKVPFRFHKGTRINYHHRVDSIDIAPYQIDSLVKDVEWIDSVRVNDVWLFLTFTNRIPLNVYASFRCLKENGDTIMDPHDPTKPYILFPEQDTIRIEGATYSDAARTISETKSIIRCRVTQEHLDLFPQIKKIVYNVGVDDKSLAESMPGAEITGDNSLKVFIGLTADIKAVMDLQNVNKKK